MDRDEKKLDESLETLITKCTDLKSSIGSFLLKLESDVTAGTAAASSSSSGGGGGNSGSTSSAENSSTVSWTSALDSYAQISGQMNSVMRLLKSENPLTANLKNLTFLPILLSPDPDSELSLLTEGRVTCFNHDMVPAYLRTKLDPEFERAESASALKAASMSQDAGTKAVNLVNKIVGQVSESVKGWREEYESSSESMLRAGLVSNTSSPTDTNSIISAITFGKGVKGPPTPDSKQLLLQQQQQQAAAAAAAQQTTGKGKAPTVRTNIKTNVHPYSKN